MATLTRITAEDFERIASLLGPCELIDGEIVRMSPGGVQHSAVTVRIVFALETHNRRVRAGRVLSNEAGVVVKRDPDTVRGADALFISHARLPAHEDWKGFLQHPPELIAEVFSEDDSWKKMETKVAEYHAFGVDMVWVVDPRTLSVRLHPRGGTPSVLHGPDELTTADYLPGFRCKVSELFAD